MALERAEHFVAMSRMAPGLAGAYGAAIAASEAAKNYLMSQNDLNSLTGTDKDKSEKDLRVAALVTAAGISEEYARAHYNFIENGFNGPEDYGTFGKMLDDEKYWNYLEDPKNIDERRKIADSLAEPFLEEGKKMGLNGAELHQYVCECTKQKMIDSGATPEAALKAVEVVQDSSEMRKLTQEQSQAISQIAGVEATQNVVNLNDEMDEMFKNSKSPTATKDMMSKRSEVREAVNDLKDKVYDAEEAKGKSTDRSEFKKSEESDLLAAFGDFGAEALASIEKESVVKEEAIAQADESNLEAAKEAKPEVKEFVAEAKEEVKPEIKNLVANAGTKKQIDEAAEATNKATEEVAQKASSTPSEVKVAENSSAKSESISMG